MSVRRGYSNPEARLPHLRKGKKGDNFKYQWVEPPAIAVDSRHEAAAKVRQRIMQLEAIHKNYMAYAQDRFAERDWHGGWDGCMNLSETECEISGLKFALQQFGYAVE